MAAPTAVSEIKPVTVPHADRLLLDTKAAADLLSVSEKTLERLPIPRVKVNALTRWRRCDLDDYVRSLTP
jgi:hypothetical protein